MKVELITYLFNNILNFTIMKTFEIKTESGLRKEIQSIQAIKIGQGKFGKDWAYLEQRITSFYN